jgi:membrane fusion protein, multidrug efflux system
MLPTFVKSKIYFVKSLLLLFILITNLSIAKEKKDIKVVEVESITYKNITQTIRLVGTVQAKRSTVLIAKTIGTLDYIAHAGEKISRKGVIATLENADLENTYTLSLSAEKNAKDQYERIVQLEKSRLAKKQDVEDRKNQWIEAQKALNTARIEFDKTRFFAPFDGIVGGFKMREGVQVQIGNPIVSFYDPSELIVEFDIPTPILKQIQRSFDQEPNKIHKVIIDGKKIQIPHIQNMIDPETLMSPAYVNYPCNDCVIGSNIMLDFVVARRKKVIVIPFESILLRDGKAYAYVVKNNKTILCPITTGIRGKDKIEVTSGLSVGDLVVIRGHERLFPDMEVKIYEPLTPEEKSDTKKPPSEKKTSSL